MIGIHTSDIVIMIYLKPSTTCEYDEMIDLCEIIEEIHPKIKSATPFIENKSKCLVRLHRIDINIHIKRNRVLDYLIEKFATDPMGRGYLLNKNDMSNMNQNRTISNDELQKIISKSEEIINNSKSMENRVLNTVITT